MSIEFERKITLGNILTMVGMLIVIAGSVITFYYKANSTAEKVDSLSQALKEKGGEISDALDGLGQSIDKVKTDVNVIRVEVVKISADNESQQRQLDDVKDRLP